MWNLASKNCPFFTGALASQIVVRALANERNREAHDPFDITDQFELPHGVPVCRVPCIENHGTLRCTVVVHLNMLLIGSALFGCFCTGSRVLFVCVAGGSVVFSEGHSSSFLIMRT